MRILTVLIAWLAIAVPAMAQINLPEEVNPFEPITAGCQCIVPEGAEVKYTWSISGDGASLIPVNGGANVHIWAEPGQYKLMSTVVWMKFNVVTVTIDGAPQELKVMEAWDLQQFETKFKVVTPGPSPGPDPGPNPPVPPGPEGVAAAIAKAYQDAGSPAGAEKVAKAYADVAESAQSRLDVYKPAIMVDEVKTTVASSLSPTELAAWVRFWPKLNEIIAAQKLDSDDTVGFIELFREVAKGLRS